MTAHPGAAGVQLHAKPGARQAEILSSEALAFLADLHRRFDGRRLDLLARRAERQELFDAGRLPHFLTETKSVRDGD
jgi:malate synthase